MSNIVFVLGAGASKHCGIPLMDEFINISRSLLRNGEVKEVENDFNNVMDAIGKLNAVHSKAILNTSNIESVYTAFEMGKLLGRLPGIKDEGKIQGLTSAITKVIGYTLEKTTKIPTDSRVNPFQTYWDFSNILSSLNKAGRTFSVITFNYDLGLDYTFFTNSYERLFADYCLGDSNTNHDLKSVTYLKLHGSLNFGRCSNLNCKKIVPFRKFPIMTQKNDKKYSIIPILSKLTSQSCPNCGELIQSDPVIIPPTWNKTAYHTQIEKIWQRAAKEMSDAEHIFVIGYSLPDTDWFFNYLYGLGVEMETPVEGFYVYNSDQAAKMRFEKLLGPGLTGKFYFYNTTFENAVKYQLPPESGISIKTIPEILNINNTNSYSIKTYVPRG
jgi:NAD-dependent SIR2 family protein deacetylase